MSFSWNIIVNFMCMLMLGEGVKDNPQNNSDDLNDKGDGAYGDKEVEEVIEAIMVWPRHGWIGMMMTGLPWDCVMDI